MKSVKSKRFAISLLVLLSIFASSVSACACSHHREKPETDSASCHEHSAEAKAGEDNGDGNLPETINSIASEAGCICLQLAPKAVVKSENIKVEKHFAALAAVKPVEIVFTETIVSVKIDFSKPQYLSDSFYNLSPGRAPPAL